MQLGRLVLLLGVLCVLGCDDDTEMASGQSDHSKSTKLVETDTETKEQDSNGSDEQSDPVPQCDDGLPKTPFDAQATNFVYDEAVADFSVTTTMGEWSLSSNFTGCDNFVFVMYHPGYEERADGFWKSDIKELLGDSAPNTHYLFLTLEKDLSLEQRTARVREIGDRIDEYLNGLDEETKAHFANRFHYVTDDASDISLVKEVMSVSGGEVHFMIDRKQLLREGYNTSYYDNGNWVLQLRNTRYWSKYFNAQYLLDKKLEEQALNEDVLVHRVAEKEDIKGGEPFTWSLPDAKTMEAYEKLEIDLRVDCPGAGHPFVSTCGEWDTVGSIWLCGDDECTNENRRRIVKWITPYSSPGRWLIDITPELVPLAKGGDLRFMATHGDNNVGQYTYKYTVDFRFSKSKDGSRPFALETLIPRANYPFANMADAFEPFDITPPGGTGKVELYARISGHGAEQLTGCAEFCTFEHTFNVNGTDHYYEYLMERVDRCAMMVEQGVTPNQGGTWPFDRSSWCPGFTIEEWREDLTGSMVLEAANAIEHIPSYYGFEPPGGNMDARVELVYYK